MKIRILLYRKFTFFLFSVLFVSLFTLSAISDVENGLAAGDWLEYDTIEFSNTTNAFFGAWPPGKNYGNWSISEGEKILFYVTSVNENSINGTIVLGSSNFTNVRNIDVASALILSIYPWNGGFFANASDWENIVLQAQDKNTSFNVIDQYQHKINTTVEKLEVNLFNVTNYYGQDSLLYYHKKTGILLKASTSFGLYKLNISLSKTSLEIKDQQGTYSIDFAFYLPFIAIIIVVLNSKNLRNRKES